MILNELLENDNDSEFVVIAALRYCIGRQTYAPRLVTSWVKRHWDEFSPRLQKIITDDIIDELAVWEKAASLGDPCDVWTWKAFLDWLKSKDKNENKTTND